MILPQILNDKAWSDQGRINVIELQKLLKVSQNTAYKLRKDLLEEYHSKDQEREAQYSEPN